MFPYWLNWLISFCVFCWFHSLFILIKITVLVKINVVLSSFRRWKNISRKMCYKLESYVLSRHPYTTHRCYTIYTLSYLNFEKKIYVGTKKIKFSLIINLYDNLTLSTVCRRVAFKLSNKVKQTKNEMKLKVVICRLAAFPDPIPAVPTFGASSQYVPFQPSVHSHLWLSLEN